jgi:ABC-2 type transport system permease protein/sodium transport system permease protein
MVPFAILFGAVLIAVASFARTFKEAQNYMMPVIMAALIPGTAGALPGVELRGPMMVMPVANMVLLVRELLLGHFANWPAMVVAMGSTCFYALVAVVVAARLFGQEAVLFTDAGSWKTLFRRRFFPSRAAPQAAHALLYAALLFPVWFHVQGQIGTRIGVSSVLIVVFFGLLPIVVARYLKIDVQNTFSLGPASPAQWLAALMIGLGSWAVAYELLVLQSHVLPMPEGVAAEDAKLQALLAGWPFPLVLLALAIVPGVCEELTFRGFVLSGLRSGMRPAGAIFVSALLFAFFHFLLVRLGISFALGVLLGYVCWRTGSIGPGMVIHAMHNSTMLLLSRRPELLRALHLPDLDGKSHLPIWLNVATAALVVIGVVLMRAGRRELPVPSTQGSDAHASPGVLRVD